MRRIWGWADRGIVKRLKELVDGRCLAMHRRLLAAVPVGHKRDHQSFPMNRHVSHHHLVLAVERDRGLSDEHFEQWPTWIQSCLEAGRRDVIGRCKCLRHIRRLLGEGGYLFVAACVHLCVRGACRDTPASLDPAIRRSVCSMAFRGSNDVLRSIVRHVPSAHKHRDHHHPDEDFDENYPIRRAHAVVAVGIPCC